MIAFDDWLAWKEQAQRAHPGAIALAETRIARVLGKRELAVPGEFPTIHRCDLARAWCVRRGMPASWAPRALVCEGVRHALALLLPHLPGPIALPGDVYPVYARIAERAGVAIDHFATFPIAAIPEGWPAAARTVLLPCPWKLHGRAWTDDELAAAARWLRADPARRLVLDGVYSFGEALAPGVIALFDTDQVLYLDSLSKGWLHEQVFGTAVVPTTDLARLAPVFRAAAPAQAKLFVARALLETAIPDEVSARLAALRADAIRVLASRGLATTAPARGYLVPLACSAETALADHGVITIPLGVFGGDLPDRCFASALGS